MGRSGGARGGLGGGAVLAALAGGAALAVGALARAGVVVDVGVRVRVGVAMTMPDGQIMRGGDDRLLGLERKQGVAVGAGATWPGKLADKKCDEGQRKQQADGEGKGNDVHGRGRVGCVNGYHAP